MRSEIKIILEKGSSNKAKGNCFEELMRRILTMHQYDIKSNINFSGMEIDLVAKHRHNNESLYVECKAKEKVSSDELTKFAFNVDYKEVDKGYFFRTQELESQAGALLEDLRKKTKYKNLTFFEPSQIIEILKDGKFVFEPLDKIKDLNISKRILAVTYLGDFFVFLINYSNAIPTNFIVINACNNDKSIEDEELIILKENITEIQNLEYLKNVSKLNKTEDVPNLVDNIESISEVQESENWYDYLPASSERNHFVGRDEIRTNILSFFKDVSKKKSSKRIFYLNGKSGWGKSSLVLEIKGRCKNKHYKNKFYPIAIDTRSANSDNFVALSFNKIIQNSYKDGFIEHNMFAKPIEFTSNIDLLSSDSILHFLKELKDLGKYLVIIFDQFEDVFRKKDYFKTFYKFLSDVTDLKPNLIIGFSWKSDFLIQSDDPSYHIWQQAKEQAREFTISEFGEKEIEGVIKQLEGSIGKIDKSIIDRIKESSQGLPWLTKKLCIHIYDQIEAGIKKEDLIESNLNIRDLFQKDDERLICEELRAIKLIAKRAYDGTFFEETEVGDIIDGGTISSLLNKRLIIRSGANYNIYWDIYRDYLVTGEIPIIGESYLLRQGVNLCLEVFLLFSENQRETIDDLLVKHPKEILQETLSNILLELRNIGIINKIDEFYFVNKKIKITRGGFIDFITAKFSNYTPYIALKKLNTNKISKGDIIHILKHIFKQDFQDNTWDAYAKNLISWFYLSNLDIKDQIIEPKKGRGGFDTLQFDTNNRGEFIPKSSIKEVIEIIPLLDIDVSLINNRYNKDLFYLGIIDSNKEITQIGKDLLKVKENSLLLSFLKRLAYNLPKIKKLKEIYENNKSIKAKEVLNLLPDDFFDGKEISSKVIYVNKASSWVR